tara:strand:+ start:84 stop:308 length:225 start_codon:yes stop_codon:yes gene_type:complete
MISLTKNLENNVLELPKLMSRKDVMSHFNIGSTTLHRWTRERGLLRSLNIGGRKYFKVDDVQNLIEERYNLSNS